MVSGAVCGAYGAQAEGWDAIAKGRHTLIAAPTGSGKTLAAFLTCIDRLVRAGLDGGLPERTEVVYVSPLKALSNDVQRNLSVPLEGIAGLAEAHGTPLPEIRVAVRTGDTPQRERALMAKQPPHILITTPESLFILLTSESGRRGLRGVRTLILDEIHAVADDKRGSHLSLSVERLCKLADGPVTRIGLSATQRPIAEVARFLVGTAGALRQAQGERTGGAGDAEERDCSSGFLPSQERRGDGAPDCIVIDTGHARAMDMGLEMPPEELGPIATHEQWASTLDRVAELVQEHTTTLVFMNTRRLVERVAHQLELRLGAEAVVAHHGSMSRETRHAAEERLKSGEAKVCVATASLELGIDVGSGGPGVPGGVAAVDRAAAATGGALRALAGGDAQGAAVPADAGRTAGVHRAAAGHSRGQPRHAGDTAVAAGRAITTDRGRVRGRGLGGGRAVRLLPPGVPVPGPASGEVRPSGDDAQRGRRAAGGAVDGVPAPRRGEPGAQGAAERSAGGDHKRRGDSGQR